MGTEGRNRIGYERKDDNEGNGVKADKKKGHKRKSRYKLGENQKRMKEKRMGVKMIGCELGDGGKMWKTGDGNWKKKRDKLGQMKMKAKTK